MVQVIYLYLGFPGSSVGKESACNAGDQGLIPGLGRSPGKGTDNALQYYCPKNPMGKGAWQATVHGVIRVRHNLATKPPPGFLGVVLSLAQHQSPLTTLLYLSVPVSRPVFTLTSPRMQAMVGDVVELHCESQRGSPPILYRFYHENVTLGSSSVPSGRAGFKFSLTAEHSGNYSCEADNSLGVQRSDRVILSVTGE